MLWKRFRQLSGIVVLLMILACGFHYLTAHAIPVNQLADLREGMTLEEVEKLLGHPLYPIADQDHSGKPHRAAFGGGMIYCTIDLVFDENGRYKSIFHDH